MYGLVIYCDEAVNSEAFQHAKGGEADVCVSELQQLLASYQAGTTCTPASIRVWVGGCFLS